MIKTRRKLLLEFISLFLCLVVVVISASTLAGVENKAPLVGLVAGSFGAGAAFVNAIKDYSAYRRGRK